MDVNTLLFGLLLFELTERVPEPSHDKAALKTDPLRHRLARRDLDDLADACATLKERWEFLVVVSPLRIPRHRYAVQPYCRDVVSLPEPTQGTHSSTVKTRQRPDAARI